MKIKKLVSRLFIFLIVFLFFSFFLIELAKKTDTAALNLASATLSNPRFSFREKILASVPAGTDEIIVHNTSNLFPKDTLCFLKNNENRCHNNQEYTVVKIKDDQHIVISPVLSFNLVGDQDSVVVIQKTSLSINFKNIQSIPVNGRIFISLPGVKSNNANDGLPDISESIKTNGFDANGIGPDDIQININNTPDYNWTKAFIPGNASHDHQIILTKTGADLAADSIINILIDKDPGLVNPAPISRPITAGIADVYTINVKTQNANYDLIDEVDIDIAPVKAVSVSATVPEILTFIISGVDSKTLTCGYYPDNSSTSTSIPFGTINKPDSFKNVSQRLTVKTNVPDGYIVTIGESDQMGKDGNDCPGTSPAADEISFGQNKCIRDTVCDNKKCDEKNQGPWENPKNHGLGYSLKNDRGNDAVFESSDHFLSRQLPDLADDEESQIIMCGGGNDCRSNQPTEGSSIFVCYRISLPNNQPSGKYFNQVVYTASASF
ncbi:MAG: hypothetical protein QHH09_00295 [Microgenomates group bacterium]|nr:hypothetical protein [Microgenomates group bacterium]